ncbi:MAG: hypothetical protein HQK67_02450 [Desulfamplus sp.]|nr:hypothetical protein [Desulfamplus sp.]
MKIEGSSYNIDYDGKGTMVISGKLAAMPEEYEKIDDYFDNVLDAISKENISELVLDLRNLIFLNSSGIKTICVSLVMAADDVEGLHLKILCSNAITWQVEAIPTFEDLMDNLEIIFE